jgi:hypothetical protein
MMGRDISRVIGKVNGAGLSTTTTGIVISTVTIGKNIIETGMTGSGSEAEPAATEA